MLPAEERGDVRRRRRQRARAVHRERRERDQLADVDGGGGAGPVAVAGCDRARVGLVGRARRRPGRGEATRPGDVPHLGHRCRNGVRVARACVQPIEADEARVRDRRCDAGDSRGRGARVDRARLDVDRVGLVRDVDVRGETTARLHAHRRRRRAEAGGAGPEREGEVRRRDLGRGRRDAEELLREVRCRILTTDRGPARARRADERARAALGGDLRDEQVARHEAGRLRDRRASLRRPSRPS